MWPWINGQASPLCGEERLSSLLASRSSQCSRQSRATSSARHTSCARPHALSDRRRGCSGAGCRLTARISVFRGTGISPVIGILAPGSSSIPGTMALRPKQRSLLSHHRSPSRVSRPSATVLQRRRNPVRQNPRRRKAFPAGDKTRLKLFAISRSLGARAGTRSICPLIKGQAPLAGGGRCRVPPCGGAMLTLLRLPS
jgi:hypothetical protein